MAKRTSPDPGRTRTALLGKFVKQQVSLGLDESSALEYANVVGSAIDFKGWFFGDESPVTWPFEQTVELVRDLMPTKVVGGEDYALSVVPAMRAYLSFLVAAGRLKSPPQEAERIAQTLVEQQEAITAAFLDPDTGTVGSRLARMALAQGVDLGDESAMDAFVQQFNAQPREWRDAALGFDSVPEAPATPERDETARLSGITGLDGEAPTVHLRRVDEAEELATLSALPLWGTIAAVLAWVTPGRAISEDLMPATEEMPGLLNALGLPADLAGSMWDLEWGVELWLTLRELQLVEPAEGQARLGAKAHEWPVAGPGTLSQGRDLVAAFATTAFLIVAMHGKNDSRLGDFPAGAFIVALAFAAQPSGATIPSDDFDPTDEAASVEDRSRFLAYEAMLNLNWAGILTTDLTGTRWMLRPGLHRALAPLFEAAPMRVEFDA